MRAHIDAVTGLLEPLYPVHFVDAPAQTTPGYVLLWTGAGSPGAEVAVCGTHTDLDARLGVTAVAGTTDGVLDMLVALRAVLQPAGRSLALAVPGRRAWLRLVESRDVQVDRQVTYPPANRNPAFGVDLYRLVSTPA